MGCGCGKNKSVQAPPSQSPDAAVAAARVSGNVQMHDVHDLDGEFVASFSNIVTARAEARRVSGTVKTRSAMAAVAPTGKG